MPIIKYLFSIVFFASTPALSVPWMPWDTQNQPKTQTKTNDIRHSKMDDYYEGLANYYQQMENQNNYYGYKSKGYFDYMPGMGNNFPAK